MISIDRSAGPRRHETLRNRTFGLIALAVSLLAGCGTYGDLSPSGKPTDLASLAAARSLGEVVTVSPATDWWRSFGDPQLDALVEEALRSNPSLRVAEARLAGARALADVANSLRMPQLMANFQGTKERFPENYIWPPGFGGEYFSQGRVALDFSYEIDFWGRNRALLDATLSQLKAAEVDREAARLLLAVAVARGYVELDRFCVQRDLVERLIAERRTAYKLVAARSDAGLDEQAAAARYAARLAAAEGELPAVDQQIALVRHQIAALLGVGPDRGLAVERPRLVDAGRLGLPSTLPVDLLGRRPDVVAQRLRVEAADRRGAAARAEFYPNVDLIGFLGSQALGLPKLLESGSRIAGLGAAVHLPIYGGGRLRAQLRQRYAEYDEAVAQYNETLTQSLKDIANAVSNWRGVEAREASQRTVVQETTNARENARHRFEAGMSNRLTLIERQADLLYEQRRAADVRALRFHAAIELNRALGGGFPSAAARVGLKQASADTNSKGSNHE